MTNAQLIQQASQGVSELARLEGQYSAAKIMLADGDEIDIPAEKITALKQRFVAVRNAVKDALDAVSG